MAADEAETSNRKAAELGRGCPVETSALPHPSAVAADSWLLAGGGARKTPGHSGVAAGGQVGWYWPIGVAQMLGWAWHSPAACWEVCRNTSNLLASTSAGSLGTPSLKGTHLFYSLLV